MTRVETLPSVGLLKSKFDSWGVEIIGVDFDGTLIDTPALFREAMFDASAILSAPLDERGPDEVMALMTDIMNRLRPEFGVWPSVMDASVLAVAKVLQLDREDELVRIALERVHQIYTRDVPLLFDGASELVDCLNATGRNVYLMTHADPDWTRHKLNATGIAGKFAEVVCFSIDFPKAPQWQQVLERRNISPSTFLVVGDNREADILPPVSLGARGVYVNLAKKYYGVDKNTVSASWQEALETGRVWEADGTRKVIDTLIDAI
jgi:FMN phosphatase YigB (HAD superfamily)